MRYDGNFLRARFLPMLVWLVIIMLIWEAISWYLLEIKQVPLAQSKLPYIHEIAKTLFTYSPTLLREGWITFISAGYGFVLGGVAAFILAILMSISKLMEQLTFPYAVASQMIPVLGLAPIVYGIMRDEQLARTIISAYITFFPVTLNMLRGLRSVHPYSIELMHTYAASPTQIYLKLKIPAALPSLFSGLKIAAPLAVTGAILVELMGANRGIGVIMLKNLYYGPSHVYMFWSTVLVSALLGIFSYLLVSLIERFLTPWQPDFRQKGGE